MKYKNPWYEINSGRYQYFDRTGSKVITSNCGRGQIVKVFDKCFEYLINGNVVSQRAGFSLTTLDNLIRHILDDKPLCCTNTQRAKECYFKQLSGV